MPAILSQSFIASMQRLTRQEAGGVWEFVDKLMRAGAHVGLSLERIHNARDKNLWSSRISSDLRAILHKDGEVTTALYAGHHDDAYDWARRRNVERHMKTGALQIVESPEVVEEILPAPSPSGPRPMFEEHSDDYLLSLGLPPTWLPTVRKITSEDQLLQAAERLPEEVAERLLALHAGEFVTPPTPVPLNRSAMESPDSQRRFFVVEREEDLQRMLEAPFAQWLVFLHPSQRTLAEGHFNGPVKVTGSAGTGKTVVAMHRAAHLARQDKKVLLTTFAVTLSEDIERNMKLFGNEPWTRNITVRSLHKEAVATVKQRFNVTPVDQDRVRQLLQRGHDRLQPTLDLKFLISEWEHVISPQAIESWDEYRDASRAGRGRPLSIKQRKEAWSVFGPVIGELNSHQSLPFSYICKRAATLLAEGQVGSPYDACIVDETQDLGPQELRFLVALAGTKPHSMMLVGDAGQRIYSPGQTLKACGIDVRGRSYVLRVNYRTTAEIRQFADEIGGDRPADAAFPEEGTESRKSTRSLLRGPRPQLQGFRTGTLQFEYIAERVAQLQKSGLEAADMGLFARTNNLLKEAARQLNQRGVPTHLVGDGDRSTSDSGVQCATMHRSKGLEFRTVFVVDCSDDHVPLRSLMKSTLDAADREDAQQRERHLLYVSLTRARDELYVTWVGDPSPFLDKVIEAHTAAEPALA